MEETQLINQIQIGNKQAFRFLVKKYERLVFHIAGRLLDRQEDLEDVSQEVFIKIHKKLDEFRGDAKLSTWIATIAYRTAVNHLKKKKVQAEEYDQEEMGHKEHFVSNETPESLTSKIEMKQVVRKLVDSLPPKYKTVLSLYHLEEYSYQEIEEITGMPEGTVKNYIFRARKLLKEKLIKQPEIMEGV